MTIPGVACLAVNAFLKIAMGPRSFPGISSFNTCAEMCKSDAASQVHHSNPNSKPFRNGEQEPINSYLELPCAIHTMKRRLLGSAPKRLPNRHQHKGLRRGLQPSGQLLIGGGEMLLESGVFLLLLLILLVGAAWGSQGIQHFRLCLHAG
jgi:hypothetical protein